MLLNVYPVSLSTQLSIVSERQTDGSDISPLKESEKISSTKYSQSSPNSFPGIHSPVSLSNSSRRFPNPVPTQGCSCPHFNCFLSWIGEQCSIIGKIEKSGLMRWTQCLWVCNYAIDLWNYFLRRNFFCSKLAVKQKNEEDWVKRMQTDTSTNIDMNMDLNMTNTKEN